MYLLDTDTIIYSLKGHSLVKKNLSEHIHDPIKISAVTLMELYYGAYKSQKVESNLAKIKTLENSMDVIQLGKESAELFGIFKANWRREAHHWMTSIHPCLLCAHNLILVTNNIQHFERVEGLKLTNWAIYPESTNL
jgi:predicted nucleic acid-binding protein